LARRLGGTQNRNGSGRKEKAVCCWWRSRPNCLGAQPVAKALYWLKYFGFGESIVKLTI
jgi:hypothetical protein